MNNVNGWCLLKHPSEVMPINDIKWHIPGYDCWCNPRLDEDCILVHNSMDNRENTYEKGLTQ